MLHRADEHSNMYAGKTYANPLRNWLALPSSTEVRNIINALGEFIAAKNIFAQERNVNFSYVRRHFIKDKEDNIIVVNRFYCTNTQNPDETTILVKIGLFKYVKNSVELVENFKINDYKYEITLPNKNISSSAFDPIEKPIYEFLYESLKDHIPNLQPTDFFSSETQPQKLLPPQKKLSEIKSQEDNSIIQSNKVDSDNPFTRDFVIGLIIAAIVFTVVGILTGGFAFIGLGVAASVALAAVSIPVVATAFAGLAAGFRALFKKEDDRLLLMTPPTFPKEPTNIFDDPHNQNNDQKPLDPTHNSTNVVSAQLPPNTEIDFESQTITHSQPKNENTPSQQQTSSSFYTKNTPFTLYFNDIENVQPDNDNDNEYEYYDCEHRVNKNNPLWQFSKFLKENEEWRLFIIKCAENAKAQSADNNFIKALYEVSNSLNSEGGNNLTEKDVKIILHFQALPLFDNNSHAMSTTKKILVQSPHNDQYKSFSPKNFFLQIKDSLKEKVITVWWKNWTTLSDEEKNKITQKIRELVQIPDTKNQLKK